MRNSIQIYEISIVQAYEIDTMSRRSNQVVRSLRRSYHVSQRAQRYHVRGISDRERRDGKHKQGNQLLNYMGSSGADQELQGHKG